MNQALYTGIIGLQANQYALNVASNNIANVDTVGFKGNSVEFKNLFTKSLSSASGSDSSSIGLGSAVAATPLMTKNGAITSTGSNTDLAINGNGWFGVQGNGQTTYTRDGAFSFDANNDLVNANGQFVLGTMANNFDPSGNITGTSAVTPLGALDAQQPIKLPASLYYPATPTTQVSLSGNLGTANVTQTIGAQAIDAKGNKNTLNLTFTKSTPQPTTGTSWDVTATLSSPATLGGTPSSVLDTQSGTFTFDSSGALLSSTLPTLNNNGTPLTISSGQGFAGLISNSSATGNLASTSNGDISGNLMGYSIDKNANVIANFSNSKQVSMAKIALYHFQNEQGLQSVGGANYASSDNSGKPFFYQDTNGNNILGATVSSGKLENSNVNLSTSLTQLIVLQRSYDANSKSITTGDQLIQKALQMSN
jgi:flagellar hook protein FlgE